MIRIELLKQVHFFKNFKTEDLDLVKEICEKRKYNASHTVYREGEEASSMFLIELGSVRIIKNAEDMVIFGKGDTFGEVSFLDGGNYQGTAVTMEESHLIEIPYKELRKLLQANPAMASGFYSEAARFVSRKLRFYIDRLSGIQQLFHSQHHSSRHHHGSNGKHAT